MPRATSAANTSGPAGEPRSIHVSRKLLRRVHNAMNELAQPNDALAHLHAARKLREAADELEQMTIDAARSVGITWTQIGAAYELSKQGAQQRFRRSR